MNAEEEFLIDVGLVGPDHRFDLTRWRYNRPDNHNFDQPR